MCCHTGTTYNIVCACHCLLHSSRQMSHVRFEHKQAPMLGTTNTMNTIADLPSKSGSDASAQINKGRQKMNLVYHMLFEAN